MTVSDRSAGERSNGPGVQLAQRLDLNAPPVGLSLTRQNLVYAAGLSGHGIMHAPVSPLLVEALVAGDAAYGHMHAAAVRDQTLDLRAFDPSRDFRRTAREPAVL